MKTETVNSQNQVPGALRWRYVMTRMVPTAVIVFLILFTFFPSFGNPVSNLRSLGDPSGAIVASTKTKDAVTVATGLQQLQASGQLGSYLQYSGGGISRQTLSWDETNRVLSISDGNNVTLSGLSGSAAAPSILQTLTKSGNSLVLSGGGSIDLSSYLDNTDNQAISLVGSQLLLSGGGAVNLVGFLDNTDAQALSLAGNALSLVNGGSVSLAPYLDNTDVLAGLSCSAGQLPEWDGSAWVCLTPAGGTDSQNLSWNGGTRILTISNGNTVDLSSLLDNTDAQAISKSGNTLSITGNAGTVDLSSYLDNTDTQTVGLAGTTLTISGGNSIDLAPINTDSQNLSLAGTTLNISGGTGVNLASINTDVLAGLSCSPNQIAKWNGSAWACAADVDTDTNTDQQTLSLASNNLSILNGNSVSLAGYLDNTDSQTLSWNSGTNVLSVSGGNTANLSSLLDNTDAQAISKTGNTLSITGNAGTVDLSGYLDNTDVLASLSCSNGQVAQWNGSAWICANAAVDTDQQTLSLAANSLSISNGNSISLAAYLDNTDMQAISVAGNILSISGNASTVDLTPYLDNTDAQALSLGGNTLSLVNGGSVNLATYLDNTDVLASLACGSGQIAKWNGSAWTCAADNDTVTNEAQVDAWVSNNGYLTSEVDGSTSNELQTLTWNGGTHILTISSGNTADLGSLLDNTDAQAISRTGNTVSISGNASTVDLSPYLDNTDAQAISKSGNTLSITGNASTVDLSSYLDNTDAQSVSLAGTTLTISGGNSIDLAPINTDSQNLSLAGTTLNISGGTGVNLASINTDVLAGLSCSPNQIAKWNGSAWACAADVDTVLNEAQVDAYANNNGYLTSEVDGSISNEIQSLSLVSDILSISGDPGTLDLSVYKDNTDAQTLSWNGGTHILTISSGNTADLGSLLDNTDAQAISRTGNTVSISGNASTVDLSPYLDNTDAQAISKSGNTLSITGNAGTVDLSGYLDNTDLLASLSCSNNEIAKWNGSAWACAVDRVLTEAEVDGFVANNGYLTSEVDGSTTNELQNIFQTIATPDAGNPVADSTADTLTLANGSGVTITSNGATDTITIAATLGTSISNAEIDDATLTFAKLASNSCNSGEIVKFNGSAWVCGADNDTVLSEATVESYIFDGDNTGTLSSGTLALGSLSYTGTLGDTNISDALTISSSGTVADGALSANVTKLGSTIESGEITDGTVTGTDLASATIQFSNIAQNGCSTNQIMKWNGSAWACAADATGGSINSFETITTASGTSPVADSSTDTLTLSAGSGVTITGDGTTDTITVAATLGADITSAEIVDGTIVGGDISDGTIANADLANSSLTVSAGTGLTGGGVVALGGTVTLNLANDFGASIDTGEITNGTILFADLGQNACSNGEVIKWNTSAWTCGSDLGLTSEVDGSTTNELQNIFQTIATPDAGNPAADTTTDTLTFANGSGVTITSNGTTDTITIAATLGTDITSAEIVDGTIAAADLGTDSVTAIKILNGEVSLAKLATDSVNGTKIVDASVANADLVNSAVTVSAGTGLTGGGAVNLGGTVTLNSSIGTSVESSEITDGTIVAADIAPDTLNFTELSDALTLDATTSVATGANNLNINLDSTGTFNIQDTGVNVLTVSASGTFLFQNSADSATSFVVNDAAALPILTVDTTANAVEVGTLVDDAADVLLVLDGVSGADPGAIAGGIYYNTTNNKFRCYQNGGWVDCVPAAYNEYAFIAGLETWTNMPAAETQYLNTPIRLGIDLSRASEFRFGISRMAGAVAAGADCRVQYATTQGGTYNNLDGGAGPEVDISGAAELKVSGWTTLTAGAKADVFLRVMCKQGDGVQDPQFRNAYIQVR